MGLVACRRVYGVTRREEYAQMHFFSRLDVHKPVSVVLGYQGYCFMLSAHARAWRPLSCPILGQPRLAALGLVAGSESDIWPMRTLSAECAY